jgi:hypothetical protein
MLTSKHSVAGFTDQINENDIWDRLFPVEGASMATLLAHDAVKTVCQIFLARGDGLPKRLREAALRAPHDHVAFVVRGEVYYGQPAAAPDEFHFPTLRWAIRNSQQIAIWSAPGVELADDAGTWICAEALAGSTFQTVIETVPSRAAEWLALATRYKGPRTEVRVFGPSVLS